MADYTITQLPDPSGFGSDPFTDVLRDGARKLMMSAQKKWRKLDGQHRLPEIIQEVEFRDGLRQRQATA